MTGIVLVWLAGPVLGGDTKPLLAGTEALGRCLAQGDLYDCQQGWLIGPYPIMQYVPDLLADAVLELSEARRVRVLATLSTFGIVAAIASGWIVLRRVALPEWRWGFLLVAASGPLLAYGNTTWGEMLATGLLTIFVAAALLPAHPLLVGVTAFGAGLTKETGYPFVVALGLVSLLLVRSRTGQPLRRHLLLGMTGIALAFAATSAFNLLRYGTPKNAYYLDPGLRTSSVGEFLEVAAGLFVSPNGGIVIFWPLASLAVLLLLAVPALRAARGLAPWRDAWPALALVAILAALTVGLAAWWQPFGWWAWGPRLSLPWVLPTALVALVAFGRLLTPHVARLLGPRANLVAVAVALSIAALPHVGMLWRSETIGEFFLRETAVCPGGGPPPTPAYYECLHELMWERRPIWLDALPGLGGAGGIGTALLVVLVVVGCLVLLRRDTMERTRAESVEA